VAGILDIPDHHIDTKLILSDQAESRAEQVASCIAIPVTIDL
jgi:hypothetical protein